MKRSRFTEEQIIAVLREQEAGAKTTDVCRKHGVGEATFYKRKARCGGMEVSDARRLKGARGRERQTEESARRGDTGQRHAAGRGGKKMMRPPPDARPPLTSARSTRVSQRRACQAIGADRSSVGYRRRRPDDGLIYQLFVGKPRVSAQQDAHPRPAGADVADDACDLLDRPSAGIDNGTTQFGRQQMPAAKNVKAAAVVIAVEEAPLLVPVQRVIGGIEIEDDLPRGTDVGIDKQINQQSFDRLRIVPDLVTGLRRRLAQFEPVERRFAGHRRTVLAPCHKLAGQHRHYRVMAQIVMVEHVLVAQRDAEDALADQRCHLMLD